MRLDRNKRLQMQQIVDETDIDELLRIIGLLDDETRALVLQAISKRLTITGKTQTLIQIKNVIAGGELLVKDWIVEAVAGSYIGGANAMYADIRKLKVSVPDGRVVQQNFTKDLIRQVDLLTVHKDAINALVSDAYLDFANGMNGLVKGAEHQLNDALKKQIRAINISKQITGTSIKTVAKEVEETIASQGFSVLKDKGFINKNGTLVRRNWTLKRYSNMLVRTHTIKAANEGAINRAVEFGVDIVEVSTHSGACNICRPYEGKKYSISGRSDDFPALSAQPPFHPNCRHALLPRPFAKGSSSTLEDV